MNEEHLNNDIYGYIYKITNKVNGKIYIGQTKNSIKARFLEHCWSAYSKNNTNIILYNSIRKYGVDNFVAEEIDVAYSKDELDDKERYWIKTLDSQNHDIGYNMCGGGEGGIGGPLFAGHHHSIETRKKMSDDRKGEKNANYGNHWSQSEELKALHSKLSSGENNGMFGKTQSKESREKSRLSHLGRRAYSNVKLNKVIMLTPEEGAQLIAEDPSWIEGNIHRKRSN